MIAVMFILVRHTQSQHLASLKALKKKYVISYHWHINITAWAAGLVVSLRVYDWLDKDLCVSPVRQSLGWRCRELNRWLGPVLFIQITSCNNCHTLQTYDTASCIRQSMTTTRDCEAVVCFCWHLLGSETHSCGGPRALLNIALFWSASFCLIF